MPSRVSKRAKMANDQPQKHEQLKPSVVSEDESSSNLTDGESMLYEANMSPTPSISFSTPPSEYTESPKSFKKRKQDQLESDSNFKYEMVQIRKGDAQARDPTELPIIATTAQGERKVLWCKMDTGAAVNIIAEKLVGKLGRTHEITPGVLEVHEIGGNSLIIDRKIKLTFNAGRKNVLCKDVEFWIPRQDGVDTDKDGVPDVLLGISELIKYHMITVDPDFCNEPEEGLQVLAPRAQEESEKPAICWGGEHTTTIYTQVPPRGK